MVFSLELILAGISIFGLFNMDPALFAFAITIILFGGLNYFECGKFM